MKAKLTIVIIFISLVSYEGESQDKSFSANFHGQAIGWTNLNFGDGLQNQWGLRYIPQLELSQELKASWRIDGELSANTYGTALFSDRSPEYESDLRPYRAWLRLSSERFFLRAGLQKINFGSASILRPLMWFDQIDPRDPLQLTDGVYGILGRYYFLNNASIWLWGLYGNENPRGWDLTGSDPDRPEYGGRIQVPAGPGEIAFTYHYRMTAKDSLFITEMNDFVPLDKFKQYRFALDGKWDLGVGLWFENVLERSSEISGPYIRWTNQLNIGIDYTFGIGNGIGAKAEHLYWLTGDNLVEEFDQNFTALTADYPLGMFDRISTVFYYNWENDSFYRFLNWSRQYDRVVLYLMAYWNPEGFDIYRGIDGTNLFSGKGFQFMLVFNH